MSDEISKEMADLEEKIIIHSCVYYEYNESIVSDYTYDMWCAKLARLLEKHPEIAKTLRFAKEFEDFDGSTGFHLAQHPWGLKKAKEMLDDR